MARLPSGDFSPIPVERTVGTKTWIEELHERQELFEKMLGDVLEFAISREAHFKIDVATQEDGNGDTADET